MDAENHAFGAKLDAVGHRLSKHLDFLIFMHTAMLMLLVAIYAFLLGRSMGYAAVMDCPVEPPARAAQGHDAGRHSGA